MNNTEPHHLSLGELIDRLEQESDKDRVVPVGFCNPHSYRGYYEDLAFEIRKNVSIQEMLDSAKSAVGKTFTGWKGGNYKMNEWTPVWIVKEQGYCGESLGAFLLELMLVQR